MSDDGNDDAVLLCSYVHVVIADVNILCLS